MTTRHRVTAAAVLIASAVAWWLAPIPDAPLARAGDAAAARRGHATPANAPDDATPPVHSAREAAVDAGAAGGAAAVPSRCARIQVVDAAGEPAAGATVRFWPPRSELARDADRSRIDGGEDVEAVLAATGSTATTDASGHVDVVADPESPLWARRGDECGDGSLPQYQPSALRDVRIALRRDVTLRVEVRDTADRPVAGCRVRASFEGLTRSQGLSRNHTVLSTDADGVAILRDALHRLEVVEPVLAGELTFTVHRGDSDSEPTLLAERRVAFAALQPQTNVQLTVPAGGTIVATVTDADGAPFHGAVWLFDENGAIFDQGPDARGDRYTFRGVPPGRRWRIEASDQGEMYGGLHHAVADLAGPRSDADEVMVALQVPVRVWRLPLRLVRTDGHPVTNAHVLVGHPALGDHEFLAETDQHGQVDFLLRGNATVADLAPLTLRISHPRLDRTESIVIHRPVRTGTTALGELVVEPLAGETLLARVEVRSAGKNVTRDAHVALFCERYPYRHWPTVARVVDGVVELRGVPPPQRMLLDCSLAGFVRPTLPPLRVGEHRVVELEPAASLCVALRADGLPTSQLHARLVRLVDGQEDRGSIDDVMHTALWWRVVPGRYRLRIGFGDRVVHEVPALELAPGVNRWPADGTRLDLRDTVKIVRVATVPLTFVDGPELLVVASGATTLPADFGKNLVHEGWVLAPPGAFDVLVRGGGFVPQRLVNPTGDITLPLQPCTWLDVEAATPWDALRVRIVSDAVNDPLLRAFDVHPHAPEFECSDDGSLQFAPGTVLDLTPVRDGAQGATQRVVVGNDGTQRVELQ
jgi:hypothetical protein